MITVRYWAGARAAAGCSAEEVAADTLGDLLDTLLTRHGDRLAPVLDCASFLVDGLATGDRDPRAVPLAAGAVVEVLPPFAGG